MTPAVEPRPGDFGLVRMRGVVGWLIRLGQWLYNGVFKDYEHAFVYVGDGNIVEAMPGGALLSPLSEYDGCNIIWSSGKIHLTDEQRIDVVAAAMGYLNTPYSFLDYFAMAAHRLRIPVPGLKRYVASTKHMLCSQLVDQEFTDAGVILFTDGRWPGYVAPSSLYELLEASG